MTGPRLLALTPWIWALSIGIHLAFFLCLNFLALGSFSKFVPVELDLSLSNIPASGSGFPPHTEEWGKPATLTVPPFSRTKNEPRALEIPQPISSLGQGHQVPGSPGGGERPAGILYQPPLVYPEKALAANIEGVVTLQVDIDATGAVKKVELLRGLGYGCDEAAVAVASQTTFIPAFKDGEPTAVRVRWPIRFQLLRKP